VSVHPINLLIPTAGRVTTIRHTLATVLAEDYDRLRVIVIDSRSSDGTEDLVRDIRDERLAYRRDEPCGMQENFERALGLAGEGLIGVLGDDDGLLAGALTRLSDLVESTGASAIRSGYVFYRWPCEKRPFGGVIHPPPAVAPPDFIDGAAALDAVIDGSAKYTSLPYLYSGGFADRELIRRATPQDGRFFQGVIPDVYSGIAVAHACGRFLRTDEAFCIAGESPRSTGRAQFRADEGEDARAFLARTDLGDVDPRSALIANGRVVPSRAAITADAALRHASVFDLDTAERIIRSAPRRVREEYLEFSPANQAKLRDVFASWHERFCAINGLKDQEPPTATWLAPTRTERVRARFARFRVGQRHVATPPQEIVGTPERPLVDVTVASIVASDALGVSGRD